MKKTFTILIAAIAAILMMAQPEKVVGQNIVYTELYSADFTTVSNHGYTQNKTFTLNSKSWTSSVSQVASSVFYLGYNKSNQIGILGNNDTFSDIDAALDAVDNNYTSGTHQAYALRFDNAYNNVTKVEFNWSGGNNKFDVYLFGYTGSSYVLLEHTDYSSSGQSISGNVVWTGTATNYTKFAIAIRPYATNSAGITSGKTLRASTFKIYTTKHILTYATVGSGSISGVYQGTSTGVASGTSVSEGAKVSLTATPTANSGYVFSAWNDGGSNTLSNIVDNTATFTMGEADVTITATFTQASQDPTITVSPASLSDFSCVQNSGDPSASQSFAVSGTNLDANITVSIAENSDFEMSAQDGADWSSTTSITLTKDGNNAVAETNIYVRMKASTTYGDKSGSISITSGTASDKSVSLSGNVIQAKTITWNHGAGGTSTTITNTYVGATLSELPTAATVNGWTFIGWAASYSSGYPVTITAPLTVTAGMSDFYAVYRHGNNVIYQLTTSTSDLSAGTRYMMGYTGYVLMKTDFSATTSDASLLDENNQYVYSSGAQYTLGSNSSGWYFTDANAKYLSSQNKGSNASADLKLETDPTDYSYWTIDYDNQTPKHALIINAGNHSDGTDLQISYYSNKTKFNCYTSYPALLFKEVTEYSKVPIADLCHVTYDDNGATEGDVPSDGTGYDPGTSVTVLGNTGNLKKTGYTWAGWCLNAEGTGTAYGPTPLTTSYTINANTTFYANWNIKSYEYTLDDSDDHVAAGLEVGGESYTAPTIPYNTEVEIAVDTDEGYGYTISVKDAGDNDVQLTNNTFNMPASPVTITVTSRLLNKYTLVTNSNQLIAGKHYYIVGKDAQGKNPYAMGSQNSGNYRNIVSVSISNDDKIEETTGVCEFVLSGSNTDGWTLYDKTSSVYLKSANSNAIYSTDELGDDCYWSVSYTDGHTKVQSNSYTSRVIRYNTGNRFACYAGTVQPIDLYLKDNDTDLEFYSPTTIASATIAADETYTVESGQILNIATLTNNGSLIVEPDAQLITTSAVPATIKQSIASATSKEDDVFGWYTISSPVADVNITTNTNLISNTYNLLRYNETDRVWENYGNDAHSSFDNTLEEGRGYLYRNENDITISYSGTINNSTVEYTVTNNGGELAGFNLIGNPYTHDIYKGASGAVPNSGASGYALASGFYTLTKEGEWHAGDDNTDPIKSGQGFLVKATTRGKITMSNVMTGGPAKGRANHDNIKFVVENNQYSDVAYAVFDKGISLNKINHRNPNSPMLYIPQAGNNYALAMMSDDTKAFNLNFKAMSMGQYTLSFKANGEFDYIHIIDLLTGDDIDMLLEGKYTFIGTPNDSDNRFIVKLAYNSGSTTSIDESFAYQSGNDIHVTGSGELQIFDVTGRMVMTTTVNGAETLNLSAQGVYIFRLIGTEIKTQKIVVR